MRNETQTSTLPLHTVGYGAWSERDRRERPHDFTAFCERWFNKIAANVQERGDTLQVREGDVVKLIIGDQHVMGRITNVFTIDGKTFVQTHAGGSFYVWGPNRVSHSAGLLWSSIGEECFIPNGTDTASFWCFGDTVGADCGVCAVVDVAAWTVIVPEHLMAYREIQRFWIESR